VAVRAKVDAVWAGLDPRATEDDLFGRSVRTAALLDPRAAEILSRCSKAHSPGSLPDQSWLTEGRPPPWAADVRLFYARWLVHESLFDEARSLLAGLQPAEVVAPASLLFYRGVADHALLDKQSGLDSIEALLRGGDSIPRRFAAMAHLMQEDLKRLDADSLEHVARRMDDVRRRLELGRVGDEVRRQEGAIIQALDQMIENIEKKQQQGVGDAQNIQSGNPAPDSRILGGRGPGEVTKKDIGRQSGWGDLPPKQREEAMQQIGRDFPAHYRDAVEQYFRRLAEE